MANIWGYDFLSYCILKLLVLESRFKVIRPFPHHLEALKLNSTTKTTNKLHVLQKANLKDSYSKRQICVSIMAL